MTGGGGNKTLKDKALGLQTSASWVCNGPVPDLLKRGDITHDLIQKAEKRLQTA